MTDRSFHIWAGSLRSRLAALAFAMLFMTTSTIAAPPRAGTGSNNGRLIGMASVTGASPFTKEMSDGAPFIDRMVHTAQALQDYSFEYQMKVMKDKPITEKGTLYFKKPPKLMRLEVTGGKRQGAVAILSKDGKVRAKPTGIPFLNVVTLSPDSRFLQSPNGYPMVDSDFLSLAQALKDFLGQGIRSRVTDTPVAVPSTTARVHVLEMYKRDGGIYKRVFVDANSLLPLEWYDYEDGKLYTISNWSNLKLNQGLSDSLFNIKGEN